VQLPGGKTIKKGQRGTHTTLRPFGGSIQSIFWHEYQQSASDGGTINDSYLRGRNLHVRDESLKFERDAHSGAIVGSESVCGADGTLDGCNLGDHSTYLNRISRPWYMDAPSTRHVCHCSAFSIASVSIHARIAKSLRS
jgi:hypothetical protein